VVSSFHIYIYFFLLLLRLFFIAKALLEPSPTLSFMRSGFPPPSCLLVFEGPGWQREGVPVFFFVLLVRFELNFSPFVALSSSRIMKFSFP